MKFLIFFIFFIILNFNLYAESFEELVNKGNEMLIKGNFNKAEEYYFNAMKKNSNSYGLYYNLGNLYYRKADFKKALYFYEKALEYKNDISKKAMFNLGNVFIRSKKYDEAVNVLRQYLKRNPNDIDAMNNYELALKLSRKSRKNKNQENKKKRNQGPKGKKSSKNEKKKNNSQKEKNKKGNGKQEKKQKNKKQKNKNQKNKKKSNKKKNNKKKKANIKNNVKNNKDFIDKLLDIVQSEEKRTRKRFMKNQTGQNNYNINVEKDW